MSALALPLLMILAGGLGLLRGLREKDRGTLRIAFVVAGGALLAVGGFLVAFATPWGLSWSAWGDGMMHRPVRVATALCPAFGSAALPVAPAVRRIGSEPPPNKPNKETE